ncbi:histidine kinase, partial [Microbacterium sp. Bi128]|uniref:histidine kinase n=1 Tax=Microbacterium sp. Bi128 TaxID=2821115 RepID=UPI001E57E877
MSTRSVLRPHGVAVPLVPIDAPPPVRSDDRLAGVLASRRAPIVFGGIVFGAVAIQVLSNPVALAAEGPDAWNLPLPFAAVVAVILIGCAVQASSLAVSARWPAVGVGGCLTAYLALAFLLGIPLWLTGMQLPVAMALFLFAARRSLGRTALAVLGVSAAHLLSFAIWAASTGADVHRVLAFLAAQSVAFIGIVVGGAALGVWWGSRSRRLAVSRAEAEAATREHETRVRRAQEAERARIAQELHDVAGQHLAGL